jgi:hypothetical protein
MTIDCPLPHPSALLDNNGYMGSAWWACIKAVHERTGGATGVSSKDMEAAIGNEAATRAAADTALQAALNAEATARANGDSAEAAARAAADTFILTYAQQTNALLHETISRGAAPLDSPHFTGNPTSPTPAPGDSDTSIATTSFVQTAVAGYLPLTGGTVTGVVTFDDTTYVGGNNVFQVGTGGDAIRLTPASAGVDVQIFSIGVSADINLQIGAQGAGYVILRSHLLMNPLPIDAANDVAAAGAGVPVAGVYRNGSALMVRVA